MKSLTHRELLQYYDRLSPEEKSSFSSKLKDAVESPDLFRRKKKSWGKNQDHCVNGRLIFEYENKDGEKVPLHHMEVELWDRDTGNPDDFLGSGRTDKNGYFEIWYDPLDAGRFDLPDLDLRVYEYRHRFDKFGNRKFRKKHVFTVTGDDNLTSKSYDFGDSHIPYWEYNPESTTPRVLITEEGNAPQSYGPGRSMVMVKALAKIELVKRKHQFASKHSIIKPTIDDIQKDYPVNLTQKMDQDKRGSSRSDSFFAECLLNGMTASVMNKDPADPTIYRIYYHWNSYEQDGIYAMPNIDIKLQLDENEVLQPKSIIIMQRAPGVKEANADMERITVTPKDGEKWEQAKRIARVSSSISAELDAHLCSTHLNVEQYAISAYRNLRKNPVRFLLFPHIKEVALINHSANSLLLGHDGYITRSTGFTEESINKRIQQTVGTLDWKNWKPRNAISSNHLHAHASNLYWSVLTEFIDWYFEESKEEIEDYWIEIKRFSDELVQQSTPVFLCNYLHQSFDGKVKEQVPWLDWNEFMDLDIPRASYHGVEKAVSAITTSSKPENDDVDNLKQVCRYVIHHATFVHWWSNSRQYDEGGELRFTSLGLRYGKNGLFTDESDDSVLPPPEDATMQLWISYMLSNSGFGFILKNEEKDIHPRFIEMLKARKSDFEKLGVDITLIPSRTNI